MQTTFTLFTGKSLKMFDLWVNVFKKGQNVCQRLCQIGMPENVLEWCINTVKMSLEIASKLFVKDCPKVVSQKLRRMPLSQISQNRWSKMA